MNYRSGQVSLFGFLGGQAGWNGFFAGSLYTGFVYGLNDSNSNYSGGFTQASASATVLGGYMARGSAGDLQQGVAGLVPNGSVRVFGASVGQSLTEVTATISSTQYSSPLQLGSRWMQAANPVDLTLSSVNELCN
jgi:hypothetical protein